MYIYFVANDPMKTRFQSKFFPLITKPKLPYFLDIIDLNNKNFLGTLIQTM